MLISVFAVGSLAAYAQLPYNTTWTQSHYNSSSTVIRKEGQQKWENNGVRLGTTGLSVGNWDDKFIVLALAQTSIPSQLTFRYKCNVGIATNPDWYIEESADNTNWSRIWSAVSPTSSAVSVSTDWYNASITLSKSTKYLKLCYSGNYAGTYADVKVTDQAYVNNPTVNDVVITSLDFGDGAISSGKADLTFDVEWCNVEALSVTSDNTAFFTVSPASFGGKVQYGTQTVTVSYDRDKAVGNHDATITMTNGSVTKTVSLSGATTKREQAIHWNAGLAATSFTLNAEDELTGEAIATADNEEAVITYTTSDAEIVAVSEDGKTLYAIANGTATITAHAPGNDIYNEVEASQLFTVTSKSKQVITWDQNLLGLKTTSAGETITLDAQATSGGVITYAIEGGAAECISLGGENNATLTITGTPGQAYIIATQAGGIIGEEEWIAATYRKIVKVRDPNSACDEYALADQSFSFGKGHKSPAAVQEYSLVGKPTNLTFTGKAGSKQYLWSEREAIFVDQYANFGSGMEWRLLTSMVMDEDSRNYGPFALNETATKIRFRTGDYSEHNVSNISVPRKREMIVSETAIVENAERNVRWTKTISVSRSNIDVVDLLVESDDPACPFELSHNSIGTDCADRGTETFTVSITPKDRDSVYTGLITITDGKAVPTTHTISLSITATGFNQTIHNFELPAEALTTDVLEPFAATATSGMEVAYLSSDSAIAYVENNQLVILTAGTVSITAYQAGDDRYEPASDVRTIAISLTPVEITTAPSASEIAAGQALSISKLSGGEASVEGSFAWQEPEVIPEAGEQTYTVIFTPANPAIYASASTEVTVHVEAGQIAQTITWEDLFPELFYYGMSFEMTATASSELPVVYTSSDESIARVEGTTLIPVSAGTVTITATQPGNEFYFAAEPVEKQLIVSLIPTTYGEYQAAFCEGDSVEFSGKWYTAAAQEDVIVAEKNIFGGDSVVTFTATVLPRHFFAQDTTINMDEPLVWREKEYGLLTPGAYTLYDSLKNIDGCDSVYALQLTVNAIPYLIQEVATACQNEEGEWRLKTLPTHEPGTVILYDSLLSQYGMDSIYELTLTVYPSYAFEDEPQAIYVGLPGVWREFDLSLIPVGDTILTKLYTTVMGCDSVYTMHLTVNEAPATYGVDSIYICGRGEVAVYDDVAYSKPSKTPLTVTLSTPNQFGGDSIVELWVLASNKYEMIFSQTITEGAAEVWQDIDLSVLPAGDTTLTVIYPTIHGCDSTFILNLTVLNPIATGINSVQQKNRPAEKFFLNGQLYIRKDERLYTPQGALIETKKED